MILWRILADRFRWIPLCWMIMSIAPWRMLTIKMTDSLSNTKRMCRVHLCHVTGEWLPNRISNLVRWKTMHTKRKSKKLLPSALRNLKPHTDDLDALLSVHPKPPELSQNGSKTSADWWGEPFFLFIYIYDICSRLTESKCFLRTELDVLKWAESCVHSADWTEKSWNVLLSCTEVDALTCRIALCAMNWMY